MILRIKDGYGKVQEILAIKGEKGEKGADGTMTFADLTEEQKASLKGDKGDTGAAGTSVTVSKVSTSSADGGSNVVTFSDGKTLTVKNGSKGSQGEPGKDGTPGKDGEALRIITGEVE